MKRYAYKDTKTGKVIQSDVPLEFPKADRKRYRLITKVRDTKMHGSEVTHK